MTCFVFFSKKCLLLHAQLSASVLLRSSRLSSHLVTRSKLEHYGFNMLLRPSKRLTQWKKRRTNESCHSMQTRSQSSSVRLSLRLSPLAFIRLLSGLSFGSTGQSFRPDSFHSDAVRRAASSVETSATLFVGERNEHARLDAEQQCRRETNA